MSSRAACPAVGMDADDLVQDVFVRLAKRGELTAIRRIEGYLTASRAATGASTRQAPI